jgi:pimeloyl-ACP methyl ester carboxylesterase
MGRRSRARGGRPHLPPVKVLLLHAWPLEPAMWDPQMAALEEAGFETEAPRLYRRGSSIDAWAGQLLGEIEGQFVAVGASMGGYTALALARRAPERVPGLVLAGSPVRADPPERRGYREELIGTLRTTGVPPDVESEVDPEELAVAQEAIRDRPDSTGVAASFGGPLLVCVGDSDELLPVDEARSIAEGALLGSLHVFPRAGHLPSVEQSSEFTRVVLEFLAKWT